MLQAVTLDSNTLQLEVSNAVVLAPPPTPTIISVEPLSASGGDPITIRGSDFEPGSVVTVNGAPVTPFSTSSTEIVIPYPAGTPCGSTVAITTPAGMSASSALNPVPIIQSQGVTGGPVSGGTLLGLQGSGFAPNMTATVGGVNAFATFVSAGYVLVTTPPGAPGPAAVVLSTPGGCTATTVFTYQ